MSDETPATPTPPENEGAPAAQRDDGGKAVFLQQAARDRQRITGR